MKLWSFALIFFHLSHENICILMYLLAYPVYTALLCPRALFDEKKRKREEALGAEERHEVGRPKRGDISYGKGETPVGWDEGQRGLILAPGDTCRGILSLNRSIKKGERLSIHFVPDWSTQLFILFAWRQKTETEKQVRGFLRICLCMGTRDEKR